NATRHNCAPQIYESGPPVYRDKTGSPAAPPACLPGSVARATSSRSPDPQQDLPQMVLSDRLLRLRDLFQRIDPGDVHLERPALDQAVQALHDVGIGIPVVPLEPNPLDGLGLGLDAVGVGGAA